MGFWVWKVGKLGWNQKTGADDRDFVSSLCEERLLMRHTRPAALGDKNGLSHHRRRRTDTHTTTTTTTVPLTVALRAEGVVRIADTDLGQSHGGSRHPSHHSDVPHKAHVEHGVAFVRVIDD